MAKPNNRTQELFKARLAARKKEKAEEISSASQSEMALSLPNDMVKTFQIPNDLYSDFTDDKELIDYLNEKTLALLKVNGAGNIMIGKELTEVFEKLSDQGKLTECMLGF